MDVYAKLELLKIKYLMENFNEKKYKVYLSYGEDTYTEEVFKIKAYDKHSAFIKAMKLFYREEDFYRYGTTPYKFIKELKT